MTSHSQIQRLLAEEPFVRDLARQLIRDEADEVVQQTYLAALAQGEREIQQPRRWLARVARNVAHNLRRGKARRDQHERAAPTTPRVPSSSELLEREERRRSLVLAIDALPDELRTIVLLRFYEGLPPREVAATLGISVATFWNRQRRALHQLRGQLDAQHQGDRRAWLLPLIPIAVPRAPVAPPPLLGPELLVMSSKSKLAVSAAVLLAALGLSYALWPTDTPVPNVVPTASFDPTPEPLPAVETEGGDDQDQDDTATVRERLAAEETVPTAETATRGQLTIQLTFADGTPAPDIVFRMHPRGRDHRVGSRRARTDLTGTVHFRELPPGQFIVGTVRGTGPHHRVVIEAGKTKELELSLGRGIDVSGVVVDPDGTPVAGAQILACPMALSEHDVDVLTTTDAAGRFALPALDTSTLVGARAAGFAPTPMKLVFAQEGSQNEVRLQFPAIGGIVEGRVLDADRRGVSGAVVRIGEGDVDGLIPRGRDPQADAPPVQIVTDADGSFRAIGLALGEHPVVVRGPGSAPWHGVVTLAASTVSRLEITLRPGARCSGTARDEAGNPIEGARISVGDDQALDSYRARTDADGRYRIDGLPAGTFEIRASHDPTGKTTATLVGEEDEECHWDPVLTRGLELKGRVLTAQGDPIEGAHVYGMRPGASKEDRWYAHADTDEKGEFALPNCPDVELEVSVERQGIETLTRRDVLARSGVVVIEVERTAPPSVRIVGRVVDAHGVPIAGATAGAHRVGDNGTPIHATDEQGRFETRLRSPGQFRAFVDAANFAGFRSELRELVADEVWDLGEIVLARGGTVRVRVEGDGKPDLYIYQDGVFRGRCEGDREAISDRLNEGRYDLQVGGEGIAAQWIPVDIRDDEETVVDLAIARGFEQTFVVTLAQPTEKAGATIRIEQASRVVVQRRRTIADGELTFSCWLAPGTYRAVVEVDGRTATRDFEVDGAGSEPLRVGL